MRGRLRPRRARHPQLWSLHLRPHPNELLGKQGIAIGKLRFCLNKKKIGLILGKARHAQNKIKNRKPPKGPLVLL